MHKLFQYSPLVFLLFLLSCGSPNSNTNRIGKSDTVVYTMKTYRIESKLASKKPDSLQDTTYFAASYPYFKDSTLNNYVQSLLVFNDNPDTSFKTLEEVGQAFINSYDEFRNEEYGSPWAWYSDIHAHVLENNSNYLSIAIDYDDFMGGAHGNHGMIFSNYNIKTKKRIVLNDIIPAGKMDSLTLIAKEIFIKQEGIDGKVKTFDNYFFKDNIFSLNDNFLLQDSSILFLYNIYEIKPYVDGMTNLEIPYQDIKSLLSAEAKEILKIK